jgi:hypothetical protein
MNNLDKKEYNEQITTNTDRDNQNPLSFQKNFNTKLNTDINDYSIDDIFKLLEMNMDEYEHYDLFKSDVKKKVSNYIEIFENLKNYKLVDFFKDVKKSLIGHEDSENKNITESQRLLEIYLENDETIANKHKNIINNNLKVQRDTVTKLLTIDSRFRSNYLNTPSTDFDVNLPYIINNVIEIRLSDIELPATFYPFQDEYQNNYIWLKYTFHYISDATYTDTKYIYFYVPSGNYYQASLITQMQTVIDAYGLPITITHDMDFNNDGGVGDGTGKITIEYSGDSNNSVVITEIELNLKATKILEHESNYNVSHIIDSTDAKIDNYYNVDSTIDYRERMGWMLGYRDSLYTSSTSYTSEGQMDIIGPRYVYLLADDFNTSSNVNFFSNKETALLKDNILGRISLKAGAFSVQAQNDFSIYGEPRYFFGPVNIDKLHVSIIDEFGRIVILNGMDFSFSIQMKVNHSVGISTG